MEVKRKICKYHGEQDFCYDNHSWRCKVCRKIAVQKRRDKINVLAIAYKGGKCQKCGYDKCVAALEFHHRDPNEKDFGIAFKGHTRSWVKVQQELDKCDLLCANCHRELHS